MRLAARPSGLAAAAAAALALAGCGDGNETASSTAPVSGRDAIADPCLLLTTQEVEDVLGVPVSAAERRSAVGALGRTGCEYSFQDEEAQDATPAGGDTGRRPRAAIAALSRDEAERALASHRDETSQEVETVDGLGEDAYFVPPHETLVVWQGDVAILVDVGAYLHAHGPEATEQLRANSRKLASRALERLAD